MKNSIKNSLNNINEFSEFSIFHQKEDLTTRIRNILDEYPFGLGPFKEFLQNADDAKARKFSVIFDRRVP